MFFYLVAKLHTFLFNIINNFIKYMFQKYYKNITKIHMRLRNWIFRINLEI